MKDEGKIIFASSFILPPSSFVQVHLGGHLNFYDAQKRAWLELHPREPLRLDDLRRELGLPNGEIMLVVVNGTVVDSQDALVTDQDRVEFYSPIGGG